jgi:D-alanyl-D-alanine carboxypeptidase
MRTTAFLTVLFLLVTATSPTRADTTDDYVRAEMAKRKIPGLSIAVINNGRVVKEAAFGVSSVELGTPATLDTVYVLASMTKVFTAGAIMLVEQDGKISLDEPIIEILPTLPSKWSAITIRHCLSHTSGLPDATIDDINLTPITGNLNDLIKILSDRPVKPAGERSVYISTDYVLLGMVIEKISGMSYQKFVQQRLLNPAGLSTARFGDAWAIIPKRADLYTALDITTDHSKLQIHDGEPVLLNGEILHYGSKYLPDYMAPVVLLNGSIRDLIKWEFALSGGKLVTPISLQEMTTPYKLRDGKNGDFGLSFVTRPIGPRPGPYEMVSYGGGAATWRVAIPEKHLTVIVLTNLQDSGPEELALGIAALYEPSIVRQQ